MVEGYCTSEEVAAYIESQASGKESSAPAEALKTFLPRGSTLLELGIGPGTDLLALSKCYRVTGSDNSPQFLKSFREAHPSFDLLELDATNIETDVYFDCIYSNKVLHHLNPSLLEASISRQAEILNPGGLLFHSFWLGNEVRSFKGLFFSRYEERFLVKLFSRFGRIRGSIRYSELNSDDSLALAVSVP